MEDHYEQPQPCPNNGAVRCADQSQCENCGWNPRVAAERLRRIKYQKNEKEV